MQHCITLSIMQNTGSTTCNGVNGNTRLLSCVSLVVHIDEIMVQTVDKDKLNDN